MATHDIFISYSRKDKDRVDRIVDILKNKGYKVWIDIDGIESGEAFRKNIVEAIENSSIIIFFSSEASNKSKWTTKEISLGVEYNKYIIPIKLDKASYNKSLILDLIDLDYIDMSEEKLVEASSQKLLRTIISKIGEREPIDVTVPRPNPEPESCRQYFFKCWRSRNIIINGWLCMLTILACCAIFIGMPYWPAAIAGLIGLGLFLFNRKDGTAFIVSGGLLWTLANAFEACPSCTVFRFFHESNFLTAWGPLAVTVITISLLLVKKNGKSWASKCKRTNTFAIVLLTMAIGLWFWIIYFDCVTIFGLSPNLRHYINRIFN